MGTPRACPTHFPWTEAPAQIYSFDRIYTLAYYLSVAWDVEFTDEFGAWWDSLSLEEQESVDSALAS